MHMRHKLYRNLRYSMHVSGTQTDKINTPTIYTVHKNDFYSCKYKYMKLLHVNYTIGLVLNVTIRYTQHMYAAHSECTLCSCLPLHCVVILNGVHVVSSPGSLSLPVLIIKVEK